MSSLKTGIRVQVRVIGSLMIRDALSRYGHENLGFFWIVFEPLMLTCIIMFVWSIMKISHGGEVAVIPFALTGYSFVTLWRHIVFRSVRIMKSNANLVYHRNIKFIDLIIARAVMETVAIFAAFVVAIVPLTLLGLCDGINDPLPLIGGFALSALFSFGFGMVLAGLSELSEPIEHFIQPIMYVTIPLTGIFFMVDWLPPAAQQIVQWSPLINGIEMFRSGVFPSEVNTHWSATYLLVCGLLTTALGLGICNFAEKRLES